MIGGTCRQFGGDIRFGGKSAARAVSVCDNRIAEDGRAATAMIKMAFGIGKSAGHRRYRDWHDYNGLLGLFPCKCTFSSHACERGVRMHVQAVR